jgi:hypothetical protein
MSPDLLRRRISRLVRDGYLPRIALQQGLAGHGEGAYCDACGKRIDDRDIRYNVDCQTRQSARRSLRLHLACHNVWQEVVQKANGGEGNGADTLPEVSGRRRPSWSPWGGFDPAGAPKNPH